MKSLPQLSNDEMKRRLTPPDGPVRLVIDTDAKNEIDDQFTIAWALLSQDRLRIEGMYAAPFSFAHHQPGLLRAAEALQSTATLTDADQQAIDQYGSWVRALEAAGKDLREISFVGPDEGMAQSYDEICLIYEKLGLDSSGQVFHGSPGYLTSLDEPIRSPATDHLIERALSDEEGPLYVVAIGCITNVVSAILLEPEVINKIVVLWTSAFPSGSHRPNSASLNLIQDLLASKFIFDCGVPHVYLPGFHIGAQLTISLPEMEAWVRGKGAIGDYLYHLYTHNPIHEMHGISDHFGRTWIMWDLITIAWLLNPDWVPTDLLPAPSLQPDTTWQHDVPGRHLMREAYGIDRDAIYRDFLGKLERVVK